MKPSARSQANLPPAEAAAAAATVTAEATFLAFEAGLYIPPKWEKAGLATPQVHIHVGHLEIMGETL